MSVKTYSLKKDGNKWLSEHFQVKEFACKDGSDKILINPALITALEKLFIYLNCKAINITSGYRTPTHSISVGGYATDQHTKGNAADITCKKQDGTLFSSKDICLALDDLNYKGGVGRINTSNSVHIDARGYKCWFDEVNNEKTCTSWYDYLRYKRLPIKGDLNGDGKITAADARIALQIAAKIKKATAEQIKYGDLDGDGKITSKDARLILKLSSLSA